jgi:hypothetical protein
VRRRTLARDDERRGILGRLRELLGRDEPETPGTAVFTARSAPPAPTDAGPRSIFEGVDRWRDADTRPEQPEPDVSAPPLFPPAPPATEPPADEPPADEPEASTGPDGPRPVPRALEREEPPRPVRSTTLSEAPRTAAAPEPPPRQEPPRPTEHDDIARLAEELTRFAEGDPAALDMATTEPEPDAPEPDAPEPEDAAPGPDVAEPAVTSPATSAAETITVPNDEDEPITTVRVHGDRIDTRPGPIRLSPSEALALARDGRSALRAERPRSS